jgi:serine/threonine protein kinase
VTEDRPSLLAAGTVFGDRYRVLRMLGGGGMGVVYEAEHVVTGRRVALKVLPSKKQSEDARKRLLREAKVAARVRHRHVIDIYDVGFEGDVVYLVMELLSGRPFDAWMADRGPAEPEDVLPFIQEVLQGLAALHAEGVTHRDLKPSNIFIVEGDHEAPHAKVLDLGIARDRGSDQDTLTEPNRILGTPAYMAPEQLERPDTIDERADLHAVAVILYEAFAGRRPYQAPELTSLAVAILTSQCPPLGELRPDLPKGLVHAIERAMMRDPKDRYPSAGAFLRALASHGDEERTAARTTRPRLWPWAMAGLALLGAAALFLPARGGPEPSPAPTPPLPVSTGAAAEPAPEVGPQPPAEPEATLGGEPRLPTETPPEPATPEPATPEPATPEPATPEAGRSRARPRPPAPAEPVEAVEARSVPAPPNRPPPRTRPHLDFDVDDF